MDVEKWQRRLEATFSVDGIVGRRLFPIYEAEKTYGEHIATTYHGHLILLNSFFDFFIESIQNAVEWAHRNGWPENKPNYSYIVLTYVTLFKRFRAADVLFLNGYPYDAYSLLRDLKDRSIFLCAVIHKFTKLSLLQGVEGLTEISPEDMPNITKRRRREEYRIHELMIGKNSKLPSEIVEELEAWEKMFHEEVHGSKFTLAEIGINWVKGKAPLRLEPIPIKSGMSMYMNRAAEIGWLITRILPFLQPVNNAFGEEWKSRYEVLDDSFRTMVQGLEKIGKKIATAFIYFVENKLSFPENLYCPGLEKR